MDVYVGPTRPFRSTPEAEKALEEISGSVKTVSWLYFGVTVP
jgi:hypothetical protein